MQHLLSNFKDQLDYLSSWGKPEIPDRLIVKPIDPWPGDAEEGRQICDASHDLRSGLLQQWPERLHRFFWLRDLRTMGGEEARQCAHDMVVQWTQFYGGRPKTPQQRLAWRSDILGERISNWISHYDFIEGCQRGHDDDFHEAFFASLYYQALFLSRKLPNGVHGLALLKAVKGLLYAGLAFEGHEAWIEKALSILLQQIEVQILPDGCHVSRSPMELMRALQILLDVKTALAAGAYPLPEQVQHAIDRAGPAMKFFRMRDKGFALMNGAHQGDAALLDSIQAQAGVRGKALQSLPSGGYERVQMGRSLLMFDAGAPPEFPHDAAVHAAPLSFELSYGKDRVFVNCGAHYRDQDWAESLRATAAHSTVCLDNRNAYEIRDCGGLARKAQSVGLQRHESEEGVLLEGFHDGYLPMSGMIHARRLYLADEGHDLRGEDELTTKIRPVKPVDIAVRFHIHPKVLVSLAQDGASALLRLPGGIGWRFQHSAGILSLEDSIYVGDGMEVRKTKQLAIYGQTFEKQSKIKWSFKREGV